jgi:hypothetical protein
MGTSGLEIALGVFGRGERVSMTYAVRIEK